jgi:hypothetical protein
MTEQAIELKNRFHKPLLRLLREDVMGLDADGTVSGNVDLEVQIAFITAGLRHANPRLTDETVRGWIDDRLKSEDKSMGPLIGPVWNCVFYSGILGYSLDVEKEAAKALEAAEGEKPETAPSTDPEADPKA